MLILKLITIYCGVFKKKIQTWVIMFDLSATNLLKNP